MNKMLPLAEQLGLVYRGGWHLPAQRLWLTGQAPRNGLRFIGYAATLPRNHSKILCHSQLAALWALQTRRVLPLPYAQPVQLGTMALELLPSGIGRGAAMLRLQTRNTTWIFVDGMRLDALPAAEQLSWREAEVLVVYAGPEQANSLNSAELKDKLAKATQELWLLDDPTLALDFASCRDGAEGVRFAPALNALIKRANLTAAAPRPQMPRLAIWPALARARVPAFAANWPSVHWRSPSATPLELKGNGVEQLLFSRATSGEALAQCVLASRIARVLALGPGAQALRDRCQSAACEVEVLHDIEQLRLM